MKKFLIAFTLGVEKCPNLHLWGKYCEDLYFFWKKNSKLYIYLYYFFQILIEIGHTLKNVLPVTFSGLVRLFHLLTLHVAASEMHPEWQGGLLMNALIKTHS